ncbi:MAG: TetR/AcrR family transcriptional regulator [Eubacteriaceae bacterium]|nr:TetR/AcrR family transcriptional regulator [Eubacteriaceae bacterium]MBR5995433.1 TetR/AcrR family transcriptional regulator [Eubacteriaceae bacterium]
MYREKPDTKRLLLECARSLFSEKEFEAVSVNEICAAAGVTKGAFYHYFDSKYDICIQQYRAIQNKFYDDIMATSGQGMQARFHAAVMWYAENCTIDDINIFRNYYRAMLNSEKSRLMRRIDISEDVFSELLNQGIKEGLLRSTINVGFYCEVITRFLFSIVMDWAMLKGKVDLSRECANLYRNMITVLQDKQ